MSITLTINGEEHEVEAAPDTPLLWVLRDHLGLTGLGGGFLELDFTDASSQPA